MYYLRLNSKKALIYSDKTERSSIVTGTTLSELGKFINNKTICKNTLDKLDKNKLSLLQYLIDLGIAYYVGNDIKFRNYIICDENVDVQDIPTVLYLLITNACNFHCQHCCWENHYKKEEELNLTQLKTLVDDMVKLGIFRLSISGGEPTVRFDDLISLCKYAKCKGITSICIATNGHLINEERLQKLYKSGVSELQFSIDHHNKIIHDGGRAKGNLEHIESLVKLIKTEYKTKLDVSAGLTLTNKNKDDIFNTIDYVVSLGIDKMKVVRFTGVTALSREQGYPIEDKEIIKSLSTKLVQKANELKKSNVIIKVSSMLSTNAYICGKNPNFKRAKNCEALRQRICVKSDGTVSPCPLLSSYDISIGNVKQNSLFNILFSKEADEFRKIYKDNSKCSKCRHYSICGGGCMASSLAKDGRLNGVDEWCVVEDSDE